VDPVVICGAGLAGLALADALLTAGTRRDVVLVDRRTSWPRDRTWCAWDVGEPLPRLLADARWPAWEVRHGGRAALGHSARHPYLHVRGDRLYDALRTRLDRDARVVLRAGEAVQAVTDLGDHVEVHTAVGTLRAAVAVDAMGGGGPLLRARPRAEIELRQRFLGWEVRTERPVFDPGRVLLMDFDVPAAPGQARFLYALPFAADRALVEDTVVGPGEHPAARSRALLEARLAAWGAGAVEVLHEERGTIAMSSHAFAAARSPRLVAAGAAAGAVRPSSGYALTRTLRHARALAEAIAADRPPPAAVAGPRTAGLDAVFLRALARDPAQLGPWTRTMVERVPGDAFARFMSDAARARDELAIVAALPPGPFVRALRRPAAPRAGATRPARPRRLRAA
jgi:lycopene beta-cyclase